MRRYMGFPFHGKISVGECVVTLKSLLPVFSKKVTPLSVLNSRPQHIFRFPLWAVFRIPDIYWLYTRFPSDIPNKVPFSENLIAKLLKVVLLFVIDGNKKHTVVSEQIPC